MTPDRRAFAALTLAYNQEDYIEASLRALAPECGALFVLYSELPFDGYNPEARRECVRRDGTRAILARLERELPHLRVIEGVWSYEDDMRNEGLAAARAAGFEYLLVVDADEFLLDSAWPQLRRRVGEHPETESWWCRMRVPFKRADRVIDRDDEYLPLVARLDDGVRFTNRRIPSGRRLRLPPELVCFNMGFVASDQRMLEKTRTWSHAHQLPPGWFREKWLAWTPDTRDLHTREPSLWPRTRPLGPEPLPAVLATHPLVLRAREVPCRS